MIRDQMLLYNELGRHTPPPPPYSLTKRDTTKTMFVDEAPERSAPPPPPPYLNSTLRSNCTIPSIDYIQRQTAASDDKYLLRNGITISLPPVHPQGFAAQDVGLQQSFEDYSESCKNDSGIPGVPAHPIEPKWTPVGILGHPGPPAWPIFPLDRSSHAAPPSFGMYAGVRIRPDHEKSIVQLPSTVSVAHSVTSCAIQPPDHSRAKVTTMDQKPLPTFGEYASKENASFANTITNNGPTSSKQSETVCATSALPSQQCTEKHVTLTGMPTSKELNAVETESSFKRPQGANSKTSTTGGPSNTTTTNHRAGEATYASTVRKSQEPTSPPGSESIMRPCNDSTVSQGSDRVHHILHSSHRRTSASARFAPYARRQSKAVEKTE